MQGKSTQTSIGTSGKVGRQRKWITLFFGLFFSVPFLLTGLNRRIYMKLAIIIAKF